MEDKDNTVVYCYKRRTGRFSECFCDDPMNMCDGIDKDPDGDFTDDMFTHCCCCGGCDTASCPKANQKKG